SSEALEIAIKGKDLDNCNFAKLMNEICVKLVDRYSEWVCKSIYSQPVLWIILTQKTIHENFIVPEIRIAEFSKLGLVQFMNDEGETDRGRFVLSLRMDLDNDLDTLECVADVWNEWMSGIDGYPSIIKSLETYDMRWANDNKETLLSRKKIVKELQDRSRSGSVGIDQAIRELEVMRN
ncbi:6390_t:CDS:2, partial [Entrophospora sp. SA101]